MLIVHHGLFWGEVLPVSMRKEHLRSLFEDFVRQLPPAGHQGPLPFLHWPPRSKNSVRIL